VERRRQKSNRKGRITAPDREENFPTDAKYTRGNLPNKTKPNSNTVEVNVAKEPRAIRRTVQDRTKETKKQEKEPRREASQKYDF
jgi:hypothetical protein